MKMNEDLTKQIEELSEKNARLDQNLENADATYAKLTEDYDKQVKSALKLQYEFNQLYGSYSQLKVDNAKMHKELKEIHDIIKRSGFSNY